MTLWAIISLLLRWLGFIRWANGLWEKHEAVKQAMETESVQVKDAQLKRAAEPKPSRADLIKRMYDGKL